jgi:SAM-dependent methyltransferase
MRRPAHLTPENAATFQLPAVVASYHLRTPYPPELTATLLQGATGNGPVLELGCGTGEIARALALHFPRIDAVDLSRPMLDRARAMPGGDHPAIRWIESPAETFEYAGPYALAVAGDSLHWMDWDLVLPALAASLAPAARLAIVSAALGDTPWSADLPPVFARHSAMRDFEAYDLPDELERRHLLQVVERQRVGPAPFTRTVADYIESLHATSSMARERISAATADAFDAAVRALVTPHATEGVLTFKAFAAVTWGRPVA